VVAPGGGGRHDPGPVSQPGHPGDAGWHIESSFCRDGQWRVSVASRERGLLALFGEYALSPRPGAPPPPVEQAIMDGLAQAGIRGVAGDESGEPEPSPKT
jgi:hypothetical protein